MLINISLNWLLTLILNFFSSKSDGKQIEYLYILDELILLYIAKPAESGPLDDILSSIPDK